MEVYSVRQLISWIILSVNLFGSPTTVHGLSVCPSDTVAKIGDNVTLHCATDPDKLLRWYFNDTANVIFNGIHVYYEYGVSRRFSVRVWDNLHAFRVELTIYNVQLNDSGRYGCITPGLDEHGTADIIVVDQSSPSLIKENISSSIVEWRCTVKYSGNLLPKVEWLDMNHNIVYLVGSGPNEVSKLLDGSEVVSKVIPPLTDQSSWPDTCRATFTLRKGCHPTVKPVSLDTPMYCINSNKSENNESADVLRPVIKVLLICAMSCCAARFVSILVYRGCRREALSCIKENNKSADVQRQPTWELFIYATCRKAVSIVFILLSCRRRRKASLCIEDAEHTRDGNVQETTALMHAADEQAISSLSVQLLPLELREQLLIKCSIVHLRKGYVPIEQTYLVSVTINLQSVCNIWWRVLNNRRRRICALHKKICRPFRLRPRLTYSTTGLSGPCSVTVINNRVYVSSPHLPLILGFDINQPNHTDGSTGIEVKAVRASNQGMQYYDHATCSQTGLPNHFDTKDIVANTTETALYVTDESIGTRKIMLHNATQGYNVDDWPIESSGVSLSLTPDNDLLVVQENQLLIFTPDGNEKRRILLPEHMIPTHAVAADASDFVCNTFFVGHTSKCSGSANCEDNTFYEVSEIYVKEKEQRSFRRDQGAGFVRLNEPPYLARVGGKHILVADSGNSRILIFVRKEGKLKLERVLLTLSDGRKPHQMCYVEETGFLVVGTDDGSINVYDIMQKYYTRSSRGTSAQLNGITRSCQPQIL